MNLFRCIKYFINTPMKPKRYLLVKKSISEEEARKVRDGEIAHKQRLLEIAQEELQDTIDWPLSLERTIYEEVLPGHPEYEKAHFGMDMAYYTGDWEWKTTPLSSDQTPESQG